MGVAAGRKNGDSDRTAFFGDHSSREDQSNGLARRRIWRGIDRTHMHPGNPDEIGSELIRKARSQVGLVDAALHALEVAPKDGRPILELTVRAFGRQPELLQAARSKLLQLREPWRTKRKSLFYVAPSGPSQQNRDRSNNAIPCGLQPSRGLALPLAAGGTDFACRRRCGRSWRKTGNRGRR